MAYNPEIHHRRSFRLRDYDYSSGGAYFVTLCAFQRDCLFGEIITGEMQLSDAGRVVIDCWQAIQDHFPQAELDEFVVMPNHLHGIIVSSCRGTACRAPTVESFGQPVAGSLATMIRSFKSAVSKRINVLRNNPGVPVWQRNYYERVIRNERELAAIRQYIADNPVTWAEDENHPTR